MIPAAFLLVLSLARAATAPGAEEQVREVFAKIETIARAQSSTGSENSPERLRQAAALKPQVLRWGHAATPVLASIAEDRSRLLVPRVWAVHFAADIRDPAALPALERLLLNPAEPETLRRAAAGSITKLKLRRSALASALCNALNDRTLPPSVLRECLSFLKDSGCSDPAEIPLWLRRLGPNPSGLDLESSLRLIKTLGRSSPRSAAEALLDLPPYYRIGSSPRAEVLRQLKSRRKELLALRGKALEVLRDVIDSESHSQAETALTALELLSDFKDTSSVELWMKLLRHPDPRFAVGAAEALAAMGYTRALPHVAEMHARLHQDKRFAPSETSPAPQDLARRLEMALRSLSQTPVPRQR